MSMSCMLILWVSCRPAALLSSRHISPSQEMDRGSHSWPAIPPQKSLWVRDLSAEAQPMRDTEDARLPFWSPDGRRIGFFFRAESSRRSISPAEECR